MPFWLSRLDPALIHLLCCAAAGVAAVACCQAARTAWLLAAEALSSVDDSSALLLLLLARRWSGAAWINTRCMVDDDDDGGCVASALCRLVGSAVDRATRELRSETGSTVRTAGTCHAQIRRAVTTRQPSALCACSRCAPDRAGVWQLATSAACKPRCEAQSESSRLDSHGRKKT